MDVSGGNSDLSRSIAWLIVSADAGGTELGEVDESPDEEGGGAAGEEGGLDVGRGIRAAAHYRARWLLGATGLLFA